MSEIDVLKISAVSNIDTSGLDKLKASLSNLKLPNDAKINQISKMATALNGFSSAVNGIDTKKIEGTLSVLEQMSRVKISFPANMDKKMTAFKNAFADIGNTKDLYKNVGSITRIMSQFKDLGSVSGVKNIAVGLNEVKTAISGLDFRKLHDDAQSLTRILQPLADVMTQLATSMTMMKSFKFTRPEAKSDAKKASETAKTIKATISPEGAEAQAQPHKQMFELPSITQDENRQWGIPDAVKIGIQEATKALSKFLAVAIKVVTVMSKLQILNPFKGIMSSVKSATKKITEMFNALKRIAIYRALRTAIKEMAKGFNEGLENLYHYSQAWGTDFAPAMDKIATAMLYLKNSVGAMVSPVIIEFANVIDYATDRLVEMLNIINQLLAKLMGRTNWTKAIKYPKEWADKTSGAIKKVKDNIQDFDELHILRTDNGGSGGLADDYSKMFEEQTLDNDFAKWIDDFKSAIQKGDWEGAGKILGDKVNSVFASISWDTLGTDVATKINDVVDFAFGFFSTTDFETIGSDIATFFNKAFESLNTEKLGKTFASKWTALIDLIYGFVSTFDFSKFGKRVSEFVQGWFEQIDGAKIAKTFSKLIVGTFDIGLSFLSNDKMLKEFSTDIVDFFNNLDVKGMVSQATRFIFNLASALVTIVTDIFKGLKWGEIFGAVVDGINEGLNSAIYGTTTEGEGAVHTSRYDSNTSGVYVVGNQVIPIPGGGASTSRWSNMRKSQTTTQWNDDLDPMLEGMLGLVQKWDRAISSLEKKSNKVSKNIVKDIKTLNKDATESYKDTATTVNTRMTEMYDTTSKEHETISKNVSDSANNIKSSMTNAMTSVNDKTRSTTSNITSMFRTVTTSATADLTSMKNGAVSTYDSMAKAVTTPLNTLKTNTVNGFKSVKDGGLAEVNSLSSSVNNSFKTMNTNVKSTLDTAKKDWTNKFTGKDGIVSSLKDSASGIESGIKDAFSNAKSGAIDSVKSLKEGVAEHFNGVIGASEGMSSGVVSGMNKVIDSFKALHFKIPDWIPDKSLANKEWKMDINNVSSVKSGSFGRIDVKKLAKGGIVTSPTNALIGEAGKEAVIPLENNTGWLDAIAERVGGTNAEEMMLLREQNEYLREIAGKEFGITERAVFNAVRNENRNYYMRTGKSLLAT